MTRVRDPCFYSAHIRIVIFTCVLSYREGTKQQRPSPVASSDGYLSSRVTCHLIFSLFGENPIFELLN